MVQPPELKYSREHMWVRVEDGGKVRIGITDYYQSQLKRINFIELPAEGVDVHKAEVCGTIESSKATNDLYSPMSGRVVAVNAVLASTPGIANSEPYGSGWFIVLEPSDPAELDNLILSSEYEAAVITEGK